MIKESQKVGGKIVLAHPKRIRMNNYDKEEYVKYLKDLGLYGIETYYSFDTNEEREFSKYLSEKYNLIGTVGSDWHTEDDHIDFGNKNVPNEHVKKLVKVFFNE